MTTKERYSRVIEYFMATRPDAGPELKYSNAFELLVAVILSAQCTDKRVNMVTPALFKKYPTAEKMAKAGEREVYEMIKSVSYPNSKSHHLVGMAQALCSEFGGEIPSERESLERLPGVGRKTANVIASVMFGMPYIAVDTHVFRVANRIGLTNDSKTPLETELTLEKHIPKKLANLAHHWLILHGRYVCTARKPKCDECGLTEVCRFYMNGDQ
ncbi:MAG: endonuclease III [Bacteroidales bacterium]|nr:endonuclease III [Bacteroidales bacterium]